MIYGHKNHSCGKSVNKIQSRVQMYSLWSNSIGRTLVLKYIGLSLTYCTPDIKIIRVENPVSVMSEWSGARVKNITWLLVTLQPPQYYIFSDPICGTYLIFTKQRHSLGHKQLLDFSYRLGHLNFDCRILPKKVEQSSYIQHCSSTDCIIRQIDI